MLAGAKTSRRTKVAAPIVGVRGCPAKTAGAHQLVEHIVGVIRHHPIDRHPVTVINGIKYLKTKLGETKSPAKQRKIFI